MEQTGKWKLFKQDLWRSLLIVLIASFFSLLINQFRAEPLSLIEQTIEPSKKAPTSFNVNSNIFINDELTARQLYHLIQNITNLILIDARREGFYEMGHIPGAIQLSPDKIEKHLVDISNWQQKEVIVYCSSPSCHDSQTVADLLKQQGFKNITIFIGGWAEWEAEGLPQETVP